MNYFGLFFTFMLPGIIIGVMIAVAYKQEQEAKRRKAARARCAAKQAGGQAVVDRTRLYVYDISEAA